MDGWMEPGHRCCCFTTMFFLLQLFSWNIVLTSDPPGRLKFAFAWWLKQFSP